MQKISSTFNNADCQVPEFIYTDIGSCQNLKDLAPWILMILEVKIPSDLLTK